MKPNLVVIPSRGRPEQAARCVASVQETAPHSDVLVIIDSDDVSTYASVQAPKLVSPRTGLPAALNAVVPQHIAAYQTVMFLGDDVLCRTTDWDELLAAPIRHRGYGWSYGDDLLQHGDLPTHWMTSTNLILALGWLAPAGFRHLYIDNVVQLLGTSLQCMDYVPAAKLEHLHYVVGKAPEDETYMRANAPATYKADQAAFVHYRDHVAGEDLERIRKTLGI